MNAQNIAEKENYTGAIIALKIPVDNAKLIAGKVASVSSNGLVDLSEYHITLAYLGETQGLGIDTKEKVISALESFSSSHKKLSMTYGGINKFNQVNDGSEQAIYAEVVSNDILDVRDKLVSFLEENNIDYSKKFDKFTPHVTLLYDVDGAEVPSVDLPNGELLIDNISLFWAGKSIDFNFAEETNINSDTKVGKRLRGDSVEKLRSAIEILLDVAGYVNYQDEVSELLDSVSETDNNGVNLKMLSGNGNDYIITWTTNSFEDREKEFFTLDSIESYVDRNTNNDNKGTLQVWHVENSDFADIVAQAVAGKFLVEISRFRNTPLGNAMKTFFLMHPKGHNRIAPHGWGCSHGFKYKYEDFINGVYKWFDKNETTILPLHEAANIYTLPEFNIGEKSMKISDKQREMFAVIEQETGAQNLLQNILDVGEKRTEELENAGFESKQVSSVEPIDGKSFASTIMEKVQEALSGVEEDEMNRVGLVRQLAEIIANVNDVELQSSLSMIVNKLADSFLDGSQDISVEINEEDDNMDEKEEIVAGEDETKNVDPVNPVDENDTAEKEASEVKPDKEDVEKEDSEKEDSEKEEDVKSSEFPVDVDKLTQNIAKSLQLESLNEMLQKHDKAISEKEKSMSDIGAVLSSLVNDVKALSEAVENLKSESTEVKNMSEELKKSDEEKLAEKSLRFTPFWGSQHQASKAAESVLKNEELNKLAAPNMPNIIKQMSKKMRGL